MNRLFKTALCSSVALAAMAASVPVIAQETTSSIRGTVVTQSGAAVTGVTVEITHVPSGTVRTIETNSDGVFFARGLKVGGPYIVKLADGTQYKANTIEDLNLVLGQSASVTLVAGADSMEEISVTGTRISSLIKTGAASEYNASDIANMNSTDRDIKSVLRMDSKIWIDPANSDALSVAGTNSRLNSLTVDGVRQNDDFGLNNGGYPTQRSPISLDAIEQIAVQTAPFDVTYGAFQGATINIVTKSGTNEFHGGAFYDFSNDGLAGSKSKDDELDLDFSEKHYGAHLGGPIIKDKLFFFASYEKFESTKPFGYTLDNLDGTSDTNEISGVTQADMDRVTSIAQSVYGFDTLGFGAESLKETDRKILAKIDWNISDSHRFSATYQNTQGNIVNPQNTRGSDAGTLSDWYNKNDKLETYSFQLFSDWTDKLSSEIKVGIKNVTTLQEPLGGTDFALMEILTENGGSIWIGPDYYRHANQLTNDALNIKAKVDYATSNHVITAGYEFDQLDVFNLFVPGSNGQYTFNSIDDFENQNAASLFYNNAYTNVKEDGGASFKFGIHTLYVQDRWNPTDDLTVFAGLRYERYANSDYPRDNAAFNTRNGFTNTENLDGKDIFLPRLGFNYALDDRTTIRGGVGLFAGGSPNVWVSNSYSNDGTIIDNVFLTNLTGVDGFTIPAAAQDALTAGDGNVNAISPDFQIPSVWKFNVAAEHDFDLSAIGLGDDWRVAVEAIFSQTKDAVIWTELRRTQVGTAPDGRPIYNVPGGYDLLLDNTGEGHGEVYSISVSKDWENDSGIYALDLGYTYQNILDVNPGQSSTADSNYGKVPTTDRNNLALAHSDFEIKHNFTANFNWQKDFWDDNTTNLNLFFSTRSGHNFSYTFDDPGSRGTAVFGGDYTFYRRDSQLLYIPTGADDPLVDMSGVDVDAFFDFIHEQGLDKYKGQIAPRNVGRSPWVTRLDMRLSQEIPVPMLEGHKVTLHLDIDNLTNLLNNKWGRFEQTPFAYNSNVVRATINDQGQYVYSRLADGVYSTFYELPSLWKVQIGITYKF